MSVMRILYFIKTHLYYFNGEGNSAIEEGAVGCGENKSFPCHRKDFSYSLNILSQVAVAVKSLPANAGYMRGRFDPWLRKIPPRGNHGNPLQYSCLENPIDIGACWATDHRVTELGNNRGDLVCILHWSH